MTHPEELLAEYVDGSLEPPARASVDAHLAECPRCRGEIELATGAQVALRALPEVAAPPGIADRALREAAAGPPSSRSADGPPRYARVLPIAAAAVLVGLLAITIPRLGGSDQLASQASAEGGGGAVTQATDNAPVPRAEAVGTTRALEKLAKSGVSIEQQEVDYDEAALRSLVDDAAAQWAGVVLPQAARSTSLGGAAFSPGAASDTAEASVCVAADVPEVVDAVLVRLIEASYQGEPAYLAVVLEGTKPGEPADAAVVYIVRKDDCSLVHVSVRQI